MDITIVFVSSKLNNSWKYQNEINLGKHASHGI